MDRRSKKWFMVDFAVPFDSNVVKTEEKKIGKYRDLAAEVARMNAAKVEVVPIVVGALGIVSKDLLSWLKMLGVEEFRLVQCFLIAMTCHPEGNVSESVSQ